MLNLNLELTDLCNIKCRMCGQFWNKKVHLQANSFMKWETWKASIDGLIHYPEEVALCPHWLGEPCMHPEFDRFVSYAFENNEGNRLFRQFKLHSNGTLLDDERIDLLLDCANRDDMAPDTFRFVHFSVDAYTPRVYQRIKGFDFGQRVYRNIGALLRRRVERGLRWPLLTIAFIVMPENRHEAPHFLDYWTRAFARHDLPVQVVYDWPEQLLDTLYFRRLHQADQGAADRLHREALDELNILPLGAAGRFHAESF